MKQQTRFILNKISAGLKLFSIELLVLIGAFLASLITVGFFIKLIFLDKKDQFDLQVFEVIKPLVSDGMTATMQFFTFFGGQYFLIPANIALIIFSFFVTKDKWFSIKVLSVALTSLLVMFGLKMLFKRPRPLIPLLEEARGLSFPSGHAFMSFAFFGLLIYMCYRQIKNPWTRNLLIAVFFIMPTIVGFSRIYLRVHYASDVFTGFSLSLIWLVISLIILGRVERRMNRIYSL